MKCRRAAPFTSRSFSVGWQHLSSAGVLTKADSSLKKFTQKKPLNYLLFKPGGCNLGNKSCRVLTITFQLKMVKDMLELCRMQERHENGYSSVHTNKTERSRFGEG
jgi:hypothetical protein